MTREGTATAVATDSTQLITSLFALIPVPVAIVEQDGRVVLANSAFSDLFQNIQNVQLLPQHELEVAGRGTYELETVPLNDHGMKIVYAAEITNEVQLRRQMVHMEKMAAIGRLVSGVAHELNNPLAGILGYAQLLSRCDLDSSARRMVDVILSQAERSGKIVQNFLSLAAKTEPRRAAFDLNDAIRSVMQLRAYRENVENISITTDLAEDLPCGWGDPHQMEQVILNLVVNAEDAIGDVHRRPGSIHIKTSVEGGHLQMTVVDNGSGIQARDMARIFDPFFTTKDRHRGTGLGLSICAEIVKDHEGELYAWSTYGFGSTFTLELPIRQQAEPEPAPEARTSQGTGLRGKQILVIDDEIHITELIFDVLARHGARVDLANSGVEALDHIKSKSYDVIICDQRMPGVSGQRLYRLAESLNPELRRRFLFVTGDVVSAETKRFFTQAGVQFIRKPFRIHELVDAIEGLLNRTQPLGS
ncbi:MAG TPA: ATP-binding protein [Terriglobia bacterium]|jgi:signal transduction histidine kinase/ActR/RegA family two-component response regulator